MGRKKKTLWKKNSEMDVLCKGNSNRERGNFRMRIAGTRQSDLADGERSGQGPRWDWSVGKTEDMPSQGE